MTAKKRPDQKTPGVCVVCAKHFVRNTSGKVCGDECRTKHEQSRYLAYYRTNKERILARVREYSSRPEAKARAKAKKDAKRLTPKGRATMREWFLKGHYGLTNQTWGVMFGQQEGLCAICCEVIDSSRHTHVDHCHKTRRVRGLLCNRCNLMVGHGRDNPAILRSGAHYVEFHGGRDVA